MVDSEFDAGKLLRNRCKAIVDRFQMLLNIAESFRRASVFYLRSLVGGFLVRARRRGSESTFQYAGLFQRALLAGIVTLVRRMLNDFWRIFGRRERTERREGRCLEPSNSVFGRV